MEDHCEIDRGDGFLVRGRLINFDNTGTKGLITRAEDDELASWFHRSALFINGKKLEEEENLCDVLSVGSPLRAVIRSSKPCFIKNSEVFFRATVVWIGTLPLLPELNLNCLLTRAVDYRIPKDDLVVNHNGGVVHWSNKKEGIIRIFGVNVSHIIFKPSMVFIGGNRLKKCDSLHHLMVYFSKCEVKARRIDPMYMFGMCVTWQAIKVSFPTPQQPLQLPIDDDILPTEYKQKPDGDNTIYSYFKGKLKGWDDDKMCFGTEEHSASVNASSVYIHGRKLSSIKELGEILQKSSRENADGLIFKSYVYLPSDYKTWQVSDDPINWEAAYAWQGEIPKDVKQTVQKYAVQPLSAQISRIKQNKSNGFSYCNLEEKLRQIPLYGKHGTLSGHILIANESHAILTSFDTIVFFPKEHFYVDGEQFYNYDSLEDYFNGQKMPIRAHTVPLKETRVILGCRVATLGVCVWIGKEPDLSRKEWNKAYNVNPSIYGEIDILSSNVNFSYLIGTISALDYNCAVLDCQTSSGNISVAFWSSSFYLYGTRFYSDYTLLDKSGILQSSTWCLLAYPIEPVSVLNKRITHIGIAVWHYQNQYQMQKALLNVMSEVPRPLDYDVLATDRTPTKRIISGKRMIGSIVDIFENYGILESKSIPFAGTYGIIWKQNIFIEGKQVPAHVSLKDLNLNRPCSFTFVNVALQNINDYLVSVESTVLWIGKKPIIPDSDNVSSDSPLKQSFQKAFEDIHIGNNEIDNSKESIESIPNNGDLERENIRSPNKVKNVTASPVVAVVAKHGEVNGNLLMANATQALITSYEDIVFFSHLNFFINGERFPKGKSLYSFLKGQKVEINSFVVPMETPKIVFNCRVASHAIAAWIGDEPEELMSLKIEYHQGMLPEGEPDNCPRNENDDDVVFSYMTGNVELLSETAGVLHCDTDFGLVKVAFWNKALYLYGTKLHNSSSLLENSSVLESSTWSILAYPITSRSFLGDTVTHCAAAVWHYNNQFQILRDILQLTTSKAREIRLETQGTEVTANGETKNGKSRHMAGWCVKGYKDCGVIQCGSRLTLQKLNIYFHRSNFWFDGEQVPSHIPIYNVANLKNRQCNVIATPVPSKEFKDFEISMESSVVWVGKKPLHLIEENIQSSEPKPFKAYDLKENPKISHSYQGKHVTGKLLDVQKDYGVGVWKSVELGGFLYFKFNSKDVFVDGHTVVNKPLNFNQYLNRICNFYVVTCKVVECCGYSCQIFASCGWMGTKPIFIPAPGKQQASRVALPRSIPQESFSNSLQANMNSNNTNSVTDAYPITPPRPLTAPRPLTDPRGVSPRPLTDPRGVSPRPLTDPRGLSPRHLTDPRGLSPRTLTDPRGLSSPVASTIPKISSTIPKVPLASADITAPKVLMGPGMKSSPQKDLSEHSGKRSSPQKDLSEHSGKRSSKVIFSTYDSPAFSNQGMPLSNKLNSVISPSISTTKSTITSASKQHTKQESLNSLQVKSKETSSPKVKSPTKGIGKGVATDIWGDEKKITIFKGEVVEIHSKIGRLKGVDGILHYFNASNCFLHGVSLKDVELWHVLMQGQQVEYILSEASLGPLKVECAWIGSKTVDNIQRAGIFIYEWCMNNMVPDGAREILVQQLQAS